MQKKQGPGNRQIAIAPHQIDTTNANAVGVGRGTEQRAGSTAAAAAADDATTTTEKKSEPTKGTLFGKYARHARVAPDDEMASIGRKNYTFAERLDQLDVYRKKHGDINVSQRPGQEYGSLGNWVNTQRTQYKLYQKKQNSPMTEERINILEGVGFIWTPTFSWNEMYQKLCWHKKRYGTANIPTRYKNRKYNRLGKWLYIQRFRYQLIKDGKKSPLKPEQIRLLNEVGVDWEMQGGKNGSTPNTYDCVESMVHKKGDIAAASLAAADAAKATNTSVAAAQAAADAAIRNRLIQKFETHTHPPEDDGNDNHIYSDNDYDYHNYPSNDDDNGQQQKQQVLVPVKEENDDEEERKERGDIDNIAAGTSLSITADVSSTAPTPKIKTNNNDGGNDRDDSGNIDNGSNCVNGTENNGICSSTVISSTKKTTNGILSSTPVNSSTPKIKTNNDDDDNVRDRDCDGSENADDNGSDRVNGYESDGCCSTNSDASSLVF